MLDRDGSCPLVYDLERLRLIDVPEELSLHVAPALEGGDLDDGLIGWLAGDDLLTCESGPADAAGWIGPRGGADDEIHCHPQEPGAAAARAAVDALLRRTEAGSRIVLHLAGRGDLVRSEALRQLVVDVERTARASGRRVGFEHTTDGTGIGRAAARFLSEHAVRVRLTRESAALDVLLTHLPERLTLCPLLDTGDRLLDCWRRARRLGVGGLAVTKIADRPFPPLAVFEAERREFRTDLFTVADELHEDLLAGRDPRPVYETFVRVMRHHLAGRRLPGLPRPPARSAEPASGTAVDDLADCRSCWAAAMCCRNVHAAPAECPARPAPRGDRCELWRAEIEIGLLLYRRLERADPELLPALADRRHEPFDDPFTHPALAAQLAC